MHVNDIADEEERGIIIDMIAKTRAAERRFIVVNLVYIYLTIQLIDVIYSDTLRLGYALLGILICQCDYTLTRHIIQHVTSETVSAERQRLYSFAFGFLAITSGALVFMDTGSVLFTTCFTFLALGVASLLRNSSRVFHGLQT
jgi:hypothetical protein